MSPAGHTPIIPPFSSEKKATLLQVLTDLRRLVIDLQYAQSAGLDVARDLSSAQQQISRLQRLYDAYFSGNLNP